MELYSNEDHHIYLLMYQCYLQGKLALKMALVTVSNQTMEDLDNTVLSLHGHFNIAVPIVDIELYDYCRNSSTFSLVVTTRFNGSYQNVLLFYDGVLNF